MNTNGYLIERHAADLIKARVGAAEAHRQATEARTGLRTRSAVQTRGQEGSRPWWRTLEALAANYRTAPSRPDQSRA